MTLNIKAPRFTTSPDIPRLAAKAFFSSSFPRLPTELCRRRRKREIHPRGGEDMKRMNMKRLCQWWTTTPAQYVLHFYYDLMPLTFHPRLSGLMHFEYSANVRSLIHDYGNAMARPDVTMFHYQTWHNHMSTTLTSELDCYSLKFSCGIILLITSDCKILFSLRK